VVAPGDGWKRGAPGLQHIASETELARYVEQATAGARRALSAHNAARVTELLETIDAYVEQWRRQVGEGVHANVPEGAPIASDVQAIVYKHAVTGHYMAHVFGGKETRFRTLHGRQVLAMDDLPGRTGVRMFGISAALILRHRDGKPLSQDFD
jgi:hypothetical protein